MIQQKAELLEAHYDRLEMLGKGGFGVVYKATDTLNNRSVAVKIAILTGDMPETERETKREACCQEGKILQQLDHAKLPKVYHIGKGGFFAMDFIEGKRLDEWLQNDDPDVNDVLNVAKQLSEVLDYLHDKGIIFCDLRPENVIVMPDGNVKLIDFGSAYNLALGRKREERDFTDTFGSPEQRSHSPIDQRSDLYSLGMILHLALIDRSNPYMPHKSTNRHKNAILPVLGNLIAELKAEEKERRPKSAKEVHDRLTKIQVSDTKNKDQIFKSIIPPQMSEQVVWRAGEDEITVLSN